MDDIEEEECFTGQPPPPPPPRTSLWKLPSMTVVEGEEEDRNHDVHAEVFFWDEECFTGQPPPPPPDAIVSWLNCDAVLLLLVIIYHVVYGIV